MKKFNEWLATREEPNISTDDELLESQLNQWVQKLFGLIHQNENKKEILEKVINDIQSRIE